MNLKNNKHLWRQYIYLSNEDKLNKNVYNIYHLFKVPYYCSFNSYSFIVRTLF